MKTTSRWRKRIYERDSYTCSYCGGKFEAKDLHIDHIISRYRGGKDSKENFTTACINCNLIKSYLTLEEFLERAKKNFNYHKEEFIRFRNKKRYHKNELIYFFNIINSLEKHLKK